MSNINVRVVGTANVTQMSSAFGKVQAQAAALNTQLAQMVALQNGVDPSGYERMTKVAAQNSKTFRNAAASTGMFEVQQLKLNRATDDYITKLNKQQMSFRELNKQRKIAAAAYKEQLAMENMIVRKNPGSNVHGKDMLDVVYPKEVSAQLDTAGKRLAFMNAQLKSGAHQMVNWGKNTQWAGRQLMVGFTMPMAAFGAAAGVMAYQVDKQLTRIAKVYDTNADMMSKNLDEVKAAEQELIDLREQATQTAIDSARKYGAAATDTLSVQAELAAVGAKGADLQESTNQVMRIATLGEIDHGVATDALISLQATLGATVQDTAKAFDFMNSVENATSLATADFAAAIPRALGPMKEMSREGASAQEVLENLTVLMVAMKERGIEAGEGANAVKALMSRVYRPSKQVSSEWEAMGLGDPRTFAEQGKDIMDILDMVRTKVSGLKGNERTQALAGLFGTYQVARMNAMLKGLDNVNTEGSQVARTFEVMRDGAEKWGETAERELATQAESIAGQWDRAFEEMKMQLSTMGKPFVQIATFVVKQISRIINGFNELPGIVKIAIAGVAGFAAIAGPIVMLTGLFANLSGQALKGIAAIVSLGAKMKILPQDSRAALLASEIVEDSMHAQTNAVNQLTAELNELTLAWKAANAESLKGATTGVTPGGVDAATGVIDDMDETGQMVLFGADDVDNSKKIADNMDDVDDATNKTAKGSDKVKRGFQAAGVASAAMATGMALTLTNSNNIANGIGDFLIMSSMVVPAVSLIAPHVAKASKHALDFGKRIRDAAKASKAASVGIMGMARGAGSATAAAAAMVHPVGWIAAAVVAVGVGIYAWKKHLEEVAREQARLHNSVNSMADKWAESTGRTKKEWAGIVVEMGKALKISKQQEKYDQYKSGDMKQVVEDYKSDEFDERERLMFLREHYMELQAEYGLNKREAAQNVRALLAAAGEGLAVQNQIAEDLMNTYGEISQSNIGQYIMSQLEMANSKDFGTKEWEVAAKDAADAFVMGFNSEMNPGQAAKLVDQFAQGATRQWAVAFNDMNSDPAVTNALNKLGIDTSDKLRQAVADAGGVDEFIAKNLSALGPGAEFAVEELRSSLTDASVAEKQFFGGIAESSSMLGIALDDNIDTFDEFVNHWLIRAQDLDLANAQREVKNLRDELVTSGTQTNLLMQTAQDFGGQNFNNVRGLTKMLNNLPTEEAAEFGAAMTTIAKMQGIKIGKNDAETYFNIIKGIKEETTDVKRETDKWGSAVKQVKLTAQELAGIQQDAWANLQQKIADTYSADLDDQHEAQMDQRNEYWDNRQEALDDEFDRRQDALDARQERESEQMDRRHERETNALENKWENRLDAAEKYWDRRVENVDRAIKVEQKAEEKRQKMFDAEIARINKLNEMANTNIDFNVALNEGNFDEAAKIRNDVAAGAAQTALERAAAAGSGRSERRIDRLEGRRDAIDEARDKHLEALQDRAEAEKEMLQRSQEREKKALQKSQDRQQKHLDKISEMRSEALDEQAEADIKALEDEQEREKESLDRQMEMFLAHTARNKKELREHMKKVGLSYDDFGKKLERKGDSWARFFRDNLYNHIRQATQKIQNDKMWSKLGKKSRDEILKGMGFNSWAAFNKFVRTGVMPKGGGKSSGGSSGGAPNGNRSDGRTTSSDDTRRGGVPETRHEGGEIGSGKGSSRKGVARSLLGLHSSETMVRAQKGEFMVNRDAAQRNADILHRINSGEDVGDTGVQHGTPRYGKGGPGGPAPFMAGVMANMFAAGLKKGVQKVYQDTVAKQAAATALYGVGAAGMFGDRSFSAEQLKNAAIIANVGSNMGMSARDIQIGIMTAIAESGLINVDYGDRDSLGLFQQRPSMGWGTPEQVTNPEYASRAFFGPLKAHTERHRESPWLAAQHIQRSAFADGSNYREQWDSAQAIFRKGLTKTKYGNYSPASGGKGGWSKPTPFGTFGGSTHDISVPVGTPVYAVGDGRITESRYITSGGSAGNGSIAPNGQPYRSYGEMMKLQTSAGSVTYGHLQAGSRLPAGTVVKGGAQIARSGNTGNSSGPHLHLDIGGAYIARSWLASRGISLRKGASNINYDGVPAVLHKNEAVLTEDLNDEFKQGVSNFSDPVSLMEQMMERAIIPSWDKVRKAKGKGRSRRGGGMDDFGNVTDTGAKATINIGTLNTKNGVSAANTQKDLARLIPKTDFLALTEMARKFGAVKSWLAKRNWGLLGGRSHDEKRAALAYNKRTQRLHKSGTRLLGKKRGNFVGGKEDRYANYGLFTDKATGRKTWQVSAHTVPTPRMDPRHRELFKEQWGNLDKLVNQLKGSGAPVFVSGDLNNNPNRDWWRTPGGLKQFRGRGVDWIFSDPRFAKAVSQGFMGGMHTDHAGAVLAGYKIPQLNVGAQNIKWDNTIANLHKGEAVLTEDINKKFRQGVDNFANGGKSEYNVKVEVKGTNATADEIAQKVMTAMQRLERRKPQSRRS